MIMEPIPDAKIADISIVEVPCQWKGMVPESEIGPEENTSLIRLRHEPSNTYHVVRVRAEDLSADQIAESRAMAKLEFIHILRGTLE
jgi:hypothetical protein